uniref:Uncharacterized protein n=1 Tax=Anopheles stephensi TaxID=30069 RepID=A0A182YRV7_ANOST
MFFQVKMKAENQRSHLFFWDGKVTPNEEPTTYAVRVTTFGATISPAECIKYEHCVDDMLVSSETNEESAQLVETVRHIHAKAGFEIRNWTSNSQAVLKQIRWGVSPEDSRGVALKTSTEKVLDI